MSVAVASRAPSLEDARAVATACGEAHENVEDVLVFGSVARGDAEADSDIDILVLVSEKADRRELADLLSEIAETVSGVHCDVAVRTAFEWQHLITNVSASFEASIEPETLRLFHREPSPHQHLQGSLDGVAADNAEIAAEFARSSADILEDLSLKVEAFLKTEVVIEGFDLGDPQARDLHYARRILAMSHDVLELSVKSIGVAVTGKAPVKTHDLDMLVDALRENSPESSTVVEAVDSVLEPLRTPKGQVKDWHGVVYDGHKAGWVEASTIDNAFNHFEAALAMTHIVIGGLDNLSSVSQQPAQISEHLTRRIAQIENTPSVKAELERRQHNRDTPDVTPA